MKTSTLTLSILSLTTLSIYLFVSAPPQLPDDTAYGAQIPVQKMFEILNQENKAVRAIWTKEIVGEGKTAGLKFDEHWREKEVEAGPLPALFLRETAKVLEKDPTSLSLFLGSDFPINSANKFGDLQIKALANIKETQKPQFFFNADIGSHSAMFSDIAVAQGCVDCHNKHPDSPKTDWKLNDIMGATTWSYPRATVSSDEIMQNIVALRRGFKEAYSEYLAKTQSFTKKPLIGDKWPKDGFYLPSLETFMKRIDEQNSGHTLEGILTIISQSQSKDIQKQGANL